MAILSFFATVFRSFYHNAGFVTPWHFTFLYDSLFKQRCADHNHVERYWLLSTGRIYYTNFLVLKL